MIGSAWVITGWVVVGGTVFLFGFLFFYDVNPPPPPTTRPSTTTPLLVTTRFNPTTTTTHLAATSPLMTAISTGAATTTTMMTTAEITTMTTLMITTPEASTTPEVTTKILGTPVPITGGCGTKSDQIGSRSVAPALGPYLLGILQGRIIGGTTAMPGEWPWMVYIYRKSRGIENGGTCGGSLLSNQWVLTAAHCLQTSEPEDYAVILGAFQISQRNTNEVFRNVSKLFSDPRFDALTFNFDVALLKLAQPVLYTRYIRPVCLVPSGTPTDATEQPTFAGASCTTLGWGFTTSPGGMRSDVLMQLNLVITPRVLCRILTLQDSEDYNNRVVMLDSPKFCAGGTLGEDSCEGDSGGPLVCLHDDGKYYVHGVTSYGTTPCAQGNKPGIYTELANASVNAFVTDTMLQ